MWLCISIFTYLQYVAAFHVRLTFSSSHFTRPFVSLVIHQKIENTKPSLHLTIYLSIWDNLEFGGNAKYTPFACGKCTSKYCSSPRTVNLVPSHLPLMPLCGVLSKIHIVLCCHSNVAPPEHRGDAKCGEYNFWLNRLSNNKMQT